jgi:hypothetical protein
VKECSESSCHNPQFGGGYCKYHQWLRKRQGGDMFKRKPKPIAKESVKRKKEHIRYIDQLKMFKDECKEQETYFCFISGEDFDDTIDGFCTVHHLRGRTGDYYLDKEFWILAKNKHHLDVFHRCTIDELKEKEYWVDFLTRLKIKDLHSYYKLLKRIEKSEELFD